MVFIIKSGQAHWMGAIASTSDNLNSVKQCGRWTRNEKHIDRCDVPYISIM